MTQTNSPNPVETPEAIIVNGKQHFHDAKGNLVPIELIKPQDILEDELVRKVIGFAEDLSAQVARFLAHTKIDLGSFDALLAQDYDVSKRGKKGNGSYTTFDDLWKIQVQISHSIAFGPQMQIASDLVDECLTEWAAESRPEIRALVTRAFNTDKEGQINQSDVFMLMRLDIDDPRWIKAMDAIRDAIKPVGSKEYIRFYKRETLEDKWQAITIDLAKA